MGSNYDHGDNDGTHSSLGGSVQKSVLYISHGRGAGLALKCFFLLLTGSCTITAV